MATMKKVQIEARLGERFRMEAKVHNHLVVVDQPQAGGGDDGGPTPLEYLLVSLAGCITAIGRIIATQRKINLRSMTVKVEGELDVEVLLGKNKTDRAGFKGLKALVAVDADLSAEEKKEFIHEIERRCPVSDNLSQLTPILVELEG
jgi:putative redox protein